jgi:hypothetical protein
MLGAHHVGGPVCRQRDESGGDALEAGARRRVGAQPLEQQAQIVVLVMGDVVGLARGEQQGIDARPEQPGEQAARAVAKAAHHHVQGRLQISKTRRAAVEGGEQIDQHFLTLGVLGVEDVHAHMPLMQQRIAGCEYAERGMRVENAFLHDDEGAAEDVAKQNQRELRQHKEERQPSNGTPNRLVDEIAGCRCAQQ